MDDFSQPGRSNMFGFPEGPNNYIVPGNRPQSTSSPVIILNGSTNALVIGASGGAYIITATVITIINHLYFGYSIKDAIDLARIHHQWCPNELLYEDGFPEIYLQELRDREHRISLEPSRQLGVVQAIMQLAPPDGSIFAHSDRRKGGVSAGY